MKKHIIWNSDINLEDWQDYLEEEDLLEADEYEQYYAVYELNNEYLYDERANLNIKANNGIIGIVDLGLWHGRSSGYKEIGYNIADCLYSHVNGISENCWYIDELGDLCQQESHHDGTNYYLYREWKDNISDVQKENFLDKLYNGKATRKDITRYTKTLGDRVCNVYGW